MSLANITFKINFENVHVVKTIVIVGSVRLYKQVFNLKKKIIQNNQNLKLNKNFGRPTVSLETFHWMYCYVFIPEFAYNTSWYLLILAIRLKAANKLTLKSWL